MPYYPEIRTLGDIARFHGVQRPDSTAFVFEKRSTSYRQFNENTNQVANGLIGEGCRVNPAWRSWARILTGITNY